MYILDLTSLNTLLEVFVVLTPKEIEFSNIFYTMNLPERWQSG